MPFLNPQIGDLYQPNEETFTFHEIFEHNNELCFRSFRQSSSYWHIGAYRREDMKFLGNGQDDPALRRRCECLTNVNFWLMYGQHGSIPRTPEYYAFIKEWEVIAKTAREVLIRKAYEKQKRWLSWQKPVEWAG